MTRRLRKRKLRDSRETEVYIQLPDSDSDADNADEGTTVMDTSISTQPKKLDTSSFDQYFANIWSKFSQKQQASFAFIDSLWFTNYHEELSRERILSWIKPKNIFSKKYVLIPIVRWNHWSLLILCHFGASLRLKNKTRCMLLLDSLHGADPKRIEPEIRRFVMDICNSEGIFEDKSVISKIPLLVPKVPQQIDSEHCGYFVLYFMSLFIKNAPANFSTEEGYPYFMKEDWFCHEELDHFCSELQNG